ncbi:MAG TPA: hypothetical protein VJ870_17305 [Amycolatopsis sp.]|nr:hypothetical protein [Amycolatopsis sp.]
MTGQRVLRLVLRLDQAGSAIFIAVALLTAVVLGFVGPAGAVLWVLGLSVIVYAAALALLGVCMAVGLTRAARRGDEVTPHTWKSLLLYNDHR